MKYKKLFISVFSALLLTSSLVSCNKKSDYNEEIYRIYQSAKEDGYQGTYEEWLESIKGEKGDKGEDGKDGSTPLITIGNNGNWFINGVDSGVKARGEDGKDATAPEITIGENGNWFIDGVDTNVKAKGEKGEDGEDGESLLTGEEKPTEILGKNGDSYINTSTWDFYVKENDKWVLKGNLICNEDNCSHSYESKYQDYFAVYGDYYYQNKNIFTCSLCGYSYSVLREKTKFNQNECGVIIYFENEIFDASIMDISEVDIELNSLIGYSFYKNGKTYKITGFATIENSEERKYEYNILCEELPPADLTIWGPESEYEFLNAVVTQFKDNYPIYKNLNFEIKSVYNYDTLTMLMSNSSSSPDVFHFPSDHLNRLVELGYLYDLSSSNVNYLGISSNVLNYGMVKNKQYGIPYTSNSYFLHYDSSVYNEKEITSLDTMLKKDISEYQYNFAFEINQGWYMQSLFYSAGCTIFGENGDDPTKGVEPYDKGLQVAEFIWQFHNGEYKNKLYKDYVSDYNTLTAAFVSGTWNESLGKQMYGPNYACAKLPKITIGGQQYDWKAVGDYSQIGVNRFTNNPGLAVLFAKYLANTDSQWLRYDMANIYPTNINNSAYEWSEASIAAAQQFNYTFKEPSDEMYQNNNYWNASNDLGESLMDASESEITSYFEKFNNMLIS